MLAQQDGSTFNYYQFFGPVQYKVTMRFVELIENKDPASREVITHYRTNSDFLA